MGLQHRSSYEVVPPDLVMSLQPPTNTASLLTPEALLGSSKETLTHTTAPPPILARDGRLDLSELRYNLQKAVIL